MSENPKDPSGMPTDASGDKLEGKTIDQVPSGSVDKLDTVAYSTFAKTVAQEKAAKARLAEVEERLKIAEAQKLEAEGKKDELITHYKTELEQLKEQRAKDIAEKTHQAISNQVVKKALESGCLDADLVTTLLDFSKLDVDQSNKVGEDSLSIALDRLKRDKPYLFSTKKAPIIDGAPATTQPQVVPQSIDDMTVEQMEAVYRQKFS